MDKKSYSRMDIIREIAKKTDYAVAPVTEIVDALLDTMKEHVINGEDCRVGYLTLGNKMTARRVGKSPKTGEPFDVPEHSVPYVKLGPTFKKEYKESKKNG